MEEMVSRIGDKYSDGDVQKVGSGDVFINNIPVARLGDSTMGHLCPPNGLWPPVPVAVGSGSVFANNKPIARVTDSHIGHWCGNSFHTGDFITGSNDVFSG